MVKLKWGSSRPSAQWVNLSISPWILGQCTFNPIQARGHFVHPSPKSQHIFKTVWSFELRLCDFSFYVFFIQKSSVPPISPHGCCHGNRAIFNLFLKTWISVVFQVFSPEINFLWDNFLCYGHHNTSISSIKANMKTVTMETFQKIICPNLVINTQILINAMVHSLSWAFYASGILSGVLSMFLHMCLAHSRYLSFVIAPAPTLTASAVTTSNWIFP